jgi:hypothetical protein
MRRALAFLAFPMLLAAPLAAVDLNVRDLAFTPIEPCRILDTRQPGPDAGLLEVNTPRSFDVAGDDAVACGIPPGEARAALLNFVAANAEGNGNLKVWAYPDATSPTTSTLNYTQGFNTTNGVVVMLCNTDTATLPCTEDLWAMASFNRTHLVVDALGYFSAPGSGPLWGEGRPGVVRHGKPMGDLTELCTNGDYEFGLSNTLVTWDNVAAGCPAGTWVCTVAQRGGGTCNTVRDDTLCDSRSCDLTCADVAETAHLGWLADPDLASNPGYGSTRPETGSGSVAQPCLLLPVWCCSL